MIRFYFLLSMLLFIFLSCRPSAQELAKQEKMRLDSVATTTETVVFKRVNNEQEILRLTTERKERIIEVKKELSKAKAMYRGAKEELRTIKEFQFGRSISTKAAQVENQCIEIQHWKDEISRLESELHQL